MNSDTDEQLVLAIQQGDISAYELLVKRYQRGLYFFVLRILHDEAAAADVVQDSLIKVYQLIESIDVSRKFSTFLFEIAKNASISLLRKKKQTISLEITGDIEDDESFIEQYLRQDMFNQVKRCVQLLPRKYKMVLTLYYFDDLSYEEISKKLKIPINTVRTHLKRAKEAFKKEFIV